MLVGETLGFVTLSNGYEELDTPQSPDLEREGRAEELRRPTMLEWFFAERSVGC